MNEESNLAIVEFKSTARGLYVTDAMLKEAEVDLVLATSLCPGKYLAIVEGETSAVESALRIADHIGGRHVYSSEVLNSINLKVIDAISGKLGDYSEEAIAIIESMQIASIINSADEVADAVPVEFVDFRLARGCGVNSFYVFSGEYSAVEEGAVRAKEFLKIRGALLAYKVISGPDNEVFRWMIK
jgi:microcompartment protein CcmL/EutN